MDEERNPFDEEDEATRDREILQNFRRYTASYIDGFIVARDRIHHLLSRQRYASGLFREALLKDFFRALLPTGVSVDSGFIYAFDLLPPSVSVCRHHLSRR